MRFDRSIPIMAVLATANLCACADDTMELGEDAAVTAGAVSDGGIDAAVQLDATPGHSFGEFCLRDDDCQSKTCYLQECSRQCASNVANDCRAEGAFCVPAGGVALDVCYGHIETGADLGDDSILTVGEEMTAKLAPVGDADLYQLTLPAGTYVATAQPASDVDVRLELYDEQTKNEATADAGGSGIAEEASFIVRHDGTRFFVVARAMLGSGNTVIRVKRAD